MMASHALQDLDAGGFAVVRRPSTTQIADALLASQMPDGIARGANGNRLRQARAVMNLLGLDAE